MLLACSKEEDTSSSFENKKVFYGDVLIESQAAVERFGKNEFHTVDGDITIASNGIRDLSPLYSLTEVLGDMAIYSSADTFQSNFKLKNLDGLENLSFVGGVFQMAGLQGLESLHALRGLKFIGISFSMQNCHSIIALDGLENLERMRDSVKVSTYPTLYVTLNNELIDYCALQNVVYAKGQLYTYYNKYSPTRQQLEDGECRP